MIEALIELKKQNFQNLLVVLLEHIKELFILL
nr:MAG TPA: hypothetical protein [Caudoviricetes sp.]